LRILDKLRNGDNNGRRLERSHPRIDERGDAYAAGTDALYNAHECCRSGRKLLELGYDENVGSLQTVQQLSRGSV
jgi:hypothetical protein